MLAVLTAASRPVKREGCDLLVLDKVAREVVANNPLALGMGVTAAGPIGGTGRRLGQNPR